MSKNPILILSGPPGAGKTTVAETLAGRSARAVHLESDAFFRFIRSGYVEPWKSESHEQNEMVMGIVAQAACGYAEAGYFTIVEGIVIPGWFYEPLRDAFKDAGHRVAYCVLRAPLNVCEKRARGRRSRPLKDPEATKRLWRSFADLGELEPHALEVDAGPGDIADALAQRLTSGLLDI